jgi:DNA helicase HerA-like ATPase
MEPKMTSGGILIGKSPDGQQTLTLKRANRHGLIAGATGTGKTVTLHMLAESFSRAGVAVFAADVKGDLSGIAAAGDMNPRWVKRAGEVGDAGYTAEACPVVFWDLYGEKGHPVRTTVTEMGPVLLSRILGLTEAQEGAMTVAFKLADDMGLLLLDMKDLRQIILHIAENSDEIGRTYGLVSPQTAAAIQRKLLQLEMDGAENFFGEPALELADMMRSDENGRGIVNLLAADKLISSPRLYATFLLWLMSELWEELPEAGDLDKPKMVFFFDEAHVLFDDAPKALLDRIEQVVRLIRSKGVGIYFITQSPTDVPESVLAQLGNRVQHALRAYTPADQKAVRAAAQSFRANPGVDVAKEIQELHVGEALVSTLDEKGAPTPVARTMIAPPRSRVGPVTAPERKTIMIASLMGAKYSKPVDRESAYEVLTRKAAASADAAQAEARRKASEKEDSARDKQQAKGEAARAREEAREDAARARQARAVGRAATRVATQVGGNVLSAVGRELVRGIFGGLKRR